VCIVQLHVWLTVDMLWGASRRLQWTASSAALAMCQAQTSARASASYQRCQSRRYRVDNVASLRRAQQQSCRALVVPCVEWRLLCCTTQCYGQKLKAAATGKQHLVALDCGSGVGRIAEQLLLQHFQEVNRRGYSWPAVPSRHSGQL
jgi:AdoMet dependent proline di-methyltransferase